MTEDSHRLDRKFSDEELESLVLESLAARASDPPHGRTDLAPDTHDFAADFGVVGKALRLFWDKNGGPEAINRLLAEILNRLRDTGIVMPSPHRPNAYILTSRGRQYVSEAPDSRKLLASVRRADELIDDYLREHCLGLLLGGKVDTAVRDATVYLESRIRDKAKIDDDITPQKLAVRALHPEQGLLKIGDGDSAFFLFAGTFGLFRNPPAHRTMADFDPVRAKQILGLVDLLLSLLEEAQNKD